MFKGVARGETKTRQEVAMVGYDWLGGIFVLLATVALMSKYPRTRAWGFGVMMIGNAFWYLFGFQVDSAAMMWTSLIFVIVDCAGMARNILYLKGK